LHVGFRGQQGPDSFPKQWVVIHDEDSNPFFRAVHVFACSL